MCGTHARVPHFPCNPNPPRACLAAHPTDGFKGRLKKHSRRLFHPPFDKKLPEKFLPLIFRAFFFKSPATAKSAATSSLSHGREAGLRLELNIAARQFFQTVFCFYFAQAV
ncbi:hypothetical protein NEIPOLOT_00183 [Neisseria polysaccharea ATCC 43768]|nr:hypothetical protein NEIPOLOT_00183 [Neisseria polysaccharea ATCC 43768]